MTCSTMTVVTWAFIGHRTKGIHTSVHLLKSLLKTWGQLKKKGNLCHGFHVLSDDVLSDSSNWFR